MKKPNKCCGFGTHKHVVSMPINGKVQCIDFCISHIVAALNAAHITTASSCCGHGKIPPSIALANGQYISILSRDEYDKL